MIMITFSDCQNLCSSITTATTTFFERLNIMKKEDFCVIFDWFSFTAKGYQLPEFLDFCGLSDVDFVDYDDYFKSQSECFFDDETRLRHRTFLRVDQKHDAVDHLQNTFDLTRKIGVSGCVDDVDFRAVVVD